MKLTNFDRAFTYGQHYEDLSTAEIKASIRSKLEGLKLAKEGRLSPSNQVLWISTYCPTIEEGSEHQKITCTFWLESKLLVFDRGWLVRFNVDPDHVVKNVNVNRIYGLNELIVYRD